MGYVVVAVVVEGKERKKVVGKFKQLSRTQNTGYESGEEEQQCSMRETRLCVWGTNGKPKMGAGRLSETCETYFLGTRQTIMVMMMMIPALLWERRCFQAKLYAFLASVTREFRSKSSAARRGAYTIHLLTIVVSPDAWFQLFQLPVGELRASVPSQAEPALYTYATQRR